MSKEITLSFTQLLQLYEEQKRQLSAFESIKSTLQNSLTEIVLAKKALEEIEKADKEKKVLFNIGAGIFIDARLGSLTEVQTLIGGNTVKKMTLKKALLKLEEKKAGIEKELKKVIAEESKVIQNIVGIERTISAIQAEQRKQTKEKSSGSELSKHSQESETPIIS